MEMMSLVLTLRPHGQARAAQSWPRWWGRAAHALVFSVIERHHAGLAADLHDRSALQPFTVSNLMGPRPRAGQVPAATYRLRLSGLTAEMCTLLRGAATEGPLRSGRIVELDYHPFRIEEVNWQEGEWSGSRNYAELAATCLSGEIPRRLSLQFSSPTTFRSQGRQMPIPLPGLVFGSLLAKWNTFAPLALSEDARRYAEECLAVSRFRLESRTVPLKDGGIRVGAIGRITYVTLNYDRYWMGVMATLAEYARFAGVGAATALGLGQSRRIDSP